MSFSGGRTAVITVCAALIAALLVLPLSAGADPAEPTTQVRAIDERPNIVLITSDDQTRMEMKWMPQTRRAIGRQGVTFTDMIAPHPNCCPARAQILTGQYAQNNGVLTNGPPNGGWEQLAEETAMPVWLSQAGYRTGFVGKYLHGYTGETGPEPGWNHFKPIVTRPLSAYYGIVQYDDGVRRELPRDVYHTDLVGQQSRDMISEFAGSDQPFFLWSSFIAPHGSCATTEERDCSGPPESSPAYAHRFQNTRLPTRGKPSFNERDISDKPGRIGSGGKVSIKRQTELFRARLRALASLDDQVASIVGQLRKAGELSNTIIVFTSDNGYMFGEHRLTGKVLAYEESIGVPMLMRGPGIPRGRKRHQTVAMIDLAPTFAKIAGAQPQVLVDGLNLLPYATDDRVQRDRVLLVQAGAKQAGFRKRWHYRAVRTRRYTLVKWRRGKHELYDRLNDPFQLTNVFYWPAYAAQRRSANRLLKELEACGGPTCRAWVKNGPLRMKRHR